MRRVMVFIDFENFNIAVMSYYRSIGEPYPRLDYNKVPQEIVKLIPGGMNSLRLSYALQSRTIFWRRMSEGPVHTGG